jgi:outer membrane protein OmpA-like peptidoglycan-associated protein
MVGAPESLSRMGKSGYIPVWTLSAKKVLGAALIACAVCCLPIRVTAQTTDTFRLYFDLNIPALNANTEKRIDLLIINNKIIDGNNIMIVGYADYLGSEEHNQKLSVERSNNVRNYLTHHGISNSDIKLCVGKGQVNRSVRATKDGYPTDRRVDIVVFHDRPKKTEPSHPPVKKDTPGKKREIPVAQKVIITDLGQISRLKAGSTIVLDNVYFPADRHVIKQESYAALEKLVRIMKENPELKIAIEGHVCCISGAEDAFDIDTGEPFLSTNRAKAIYDFLIKEGIDEGRLQYQGFGRSRPVVVVERTEEDAEKNRRVEIRVVENK